MVPQALYLVLEAMYLGVGAPYPGSEVTDLGPAKLAGVVKGLDFGLLHPSYLLAQKLDVLGTILALVEHTPVTVQHQVRFLPLENFCVAAHGYDRGGSQRFCADVWGAHRERGALHRSAGYLPGLREDEAAGNGSLPIYEHASEVLL